MIYSHLIDFLYNKTRHNNVLECPYNVLFSFSWVEQFSWHDPIYLAKTYFYIRNNAGAHLQSTKHYWIIESSSSIFRKHSWMISMRKISVHVYSHFVFFIWFFIGFFRTAIFLFLQNIHEYLWEKIRTNVYCHFKNAFKIILANEIEKID